MDIPVPQLAAVLGKKVARSHEWPRSDALGLAEALAQERLSILREDLEPDLLVDLRGRRPHIATMSQWRRKYYNQNVKRKALRKQLMMFRSTHRLGKHWPLNAGLSETRVSLRSVEAWCREFAIDEINPLSHVTVSQARCLWPVARHVQHAGHAQVHGRHHAPSCPRPPLAR